MALSDTEKLALLERYFAERPSPVVGERLRLMEQALAENPIWLKRKLNETRPDPMERINVLAAIRRKQSPKRAGSVFVEPKLTITAGLVGWWKADGITGLNDGAAVSTWPDSSGSGNNVTQGTVADKPVYKANVLNGKPVVRFDGASDNLIGPDLDLPTTGHSIFVVGKFTVAPSGVHHQAIGKRDTAAGAQYALEIQSGSSKLLYYAFDGTHQSKLSNTAVPLATFVLMEVIFTGTSVAFFQNGTADGSSAVNPGTQNSSLLNIGGTANGSNSFWPGDLAEILLYSVALSTADRQQVEAYLKSKYGL